MYQILEIKGPLLLYRRVAEEDVTALTAVVSGVIASSMSAG